MVAMCWCGRVGATALVCLSQTVSAQDSIAPSRDALCDAIEAYRLRWTSFEANYTVTQHFVRSFHTDTLAVDGGRIFIRRDLRWETEDGPIRECWIMCFDGEQTWIVVPRADHPDGILITPGLDRFQIDLEATRCLWGAWLHEFKRPLDETLRDPSWKTERIETGEWIDSLETVLIELSKQSNVRQVMRYWLAPERDYLPVKRELVVDDPASGVGEQILNEYRVTRFRKFEHGWFPVEMEWTSAGTPLVSMKVNTLSTEPGLFDARFDSMVRPPANVTDLVRDEVYQIAADEDLATIRSAPKDEEASRSLATFFEGVEPKIADAVRTSEAEYRRLRAEEAAAQVVAGGSPVPSSCSLCWAACGGSSGGIRRHTDRTATGGRVMWRTNSRMALSVLGVVLCTAPVIAQQADAGVAPDIAKEALPYSLPKHCGANSVFVASAVLGSPLPLSRCIEAVPPRRIGNSMAELKQGLERLGFRVEAYAVRSGQLSSLDGTFVAWTPPGVEVRTASGERLTTGHFVVLHRGRDGRWLFLDYPSTASVFEPETWLASVLSEHRLDELPLLSVSGKPRREYQRPVAVEVGSAGGDGISDQSTERDARVASAADNTSQAETDGPLRPDEGIAEAEIRIESRAAPLVRATLDFGSRVSGERLTGFVHVLNLLDVPVRLSDVSATCACTIETLDCELLGPGEAATIEMSLNLAGRTGEVRESLSMMASSEDSTVSVRVPIFVECIAKAAQQWSIEPRAVAFGDTPVSDGVVQRHVRITATFPAVAGRLSRADGDNPRITGSLLAASSPTAEGRYDVLVQLDPLGARPGVFAGQLYLYTETSNVPVIVVPVTARFTAAVVIDPPAVFLSAESGLTATVTCSHREGFPLRLLSSRSQSKSMDIDVRAEHRGDDGAVLQVELVCKPHRSGLVSDHVDLVLVTPDGTTHTVTLTVVVCGL